MSQHEYVFSAILLIAVFILAAVAIVGVAYLIAVERDRKRRSLRFICRFSIGFACVVFAFHASGYYDNAKARAAVTQFQQEISDGDGGLYTARYAYLGNHKIWLRLFRASDMTLLAERTYYEPDAPQLLWAKDALFYGNEDAGLIRLPPSTWDGLLARLP